MDWFLDGQVGIPLALAFVGAVVLVIDTHRQQAAALQASDTEISDLADNFIRCCHRVEADLQNARFSPSPQTESDFARGEYSLRLLLSAARKLDSIDQDILIDHIGATNTSLRRTLIVLGEIRDFLEEEAEYLRECFIGAARENWAPTGRYGQRNFAVQVARIVEASCQEIHEAIMRIGPPRPERVAHPANDRRAA